MAYSISKESLVPLLTRCLIRHGSIEAIQSYPASVSKEGRDATVCDEFIVMNEIRRYEDSEDMIRQAYEKVITASKSALDKADAEIKELTERQAEIEGNTAVRPLWFYVLGWAVVVGVAAWMDEENFSATLAASVVLAGTGLICFFAYHERQH
ncbi:hypothetical protein N9B63_04735 [Akkermansiaceae bacterium]|nr:hypothetical protein [Akkermansiaceae bacterium]